ncbi:GntR family transcriptional regulator [Paenibacillus filicis]|uniref:GntR family transcriptional regulator n=1 Tax=Paenibacillus filicis TaxID=669464 RepID=A0ABU9DX70_9BACL
MPSVPLYQHIVNRLKQQIRSGELQPGDQIPTELQLSEAFQVSRITSKRALSELEHAKLIYRVQGKGSFVSPRNPPLRSSLTSSKEILLILPFADNPGISDYIKGASDYLSHTDFSFHIQSNTAAGQRKLLQAALRSSISGVLLYPHSSLADLDILYQYYLQDFPLITLDKSISGIPLPSVVSDNFNGGYEATRYLLQHQHTRIAYLTANPISQLSSIRDRYFGYLKALSDYGISYPEEEELPGVFTTEHTIHSLLQHKITAIVAENDILAIDLIAQAKEQHIRIPGDLSIIGFDNIPMTHMIEPPLTTVAQDFVRLGYLAAESLVHRIERGQWPESVRQQVPVALLQRASVEALTASPSIHI